MSQPPQISPALLAANDHHKAGRLAEAEALYRQVLAQDPNNAEALHLLGVLANQVQYHETAKELILRAIAIDPNQARYYSNLGEVYRPLKDFPAALEAYHRAIALDPNYYSAYANMAIALQELARYDESEKVCRQAIAINPNMPHAWHTLGNIYKEQRRYDEAYDYYQKTIALDPTSAKTYHNVGVLLRHLGKIPEALHAYETGLRYEPHNPDIHLNYAIAYLLAGNFARGWEEYEWRWQSKELASARREFKEPLWTGQDITGKTISLHAEQGFGDAIQFARYIPLVAARGPQKILVECHAELFRLFQNIPNITLSPRGTPSLPFDFHAPFMSLPRALGTTLETIPNHAPYLSPDPNLVSHFQKLLSGAMPCAGQNATDPKQKPPRLRIGLIWAGRPSHGEDRFRSIPLKDFAPLFQIPNTTFVSLQLGPPTVQIQETGFPILNLSEHLKDFADTAALLTHLDLVISVDTSVAHLAGALAKPTWVLLHNAPDWRWLLTRNDSPWYPTLKLFRQLSPNNWQAVINQLSTELRTAHNDKR